MGKAKQCDRCKKLYLESIEDRKIIDEHGEWVVCVRVDINWGRLNWHDICDECIRELLDLFLKQED